jgi:hypothetical protein
MHYVLSVGFGVSGSEINTDSVGNGVAPNPELTTRN